MFALPGFITPVKEYTGFRFSIENDEERKFQIKVYREPDIPHFNPKEKSNLQHHESTTSEN
ncbi:MAG: hypothetical protein BMS9Abin25_0066 [Gammaproteobacteria bacterium]|nr:MAG: hypothetical protein BMS9Abin25_0066 [Gammaproteobacteria bacterium]